MQKGIIDLGKLIEEDDKLIGRAIEIVPPDPPEKWTANVDLKLRLLINGKPVTTEFPILKARPVGFEPDHSWSYAPTFGCKGEVTTRRDKAGTWVLKVNVKRTAIETDAREFDMESFTRTLSLEVGP